jgi:hypothetical protein
MKKNRLVLWSGGVMECWNPEIAAIGKGALGQPALPRRAENQAVS